ncbi:L-fuculose-phosphate aldolase [Levilinea saccharolytica]|uniref:Fuculose phosphate aldolase n=1 Tax=Levilinea saccharolytica TaxID=229921 RepID=A0A0P6X6B1_9CHLR|nr:L-fuculose-phosphate aldolase [Levilinea saccharolytica]KPL75771.1 fuculose phosphate aldolase [Levilinea saccharolytica]GAP17464.1 L-fuculose 1-phosphate aldolase [Levilinea saccharolytica]
MLLEKEREAIVTFGRKLITSQLTTGSGGNLSVMNREANLIAIKPSGVDYFEMQPEDVVVMTPEGRIVEGDKKPSSEVNFHLGLLQSRPEINAVVHTHSVYATTIACLNWELPAVHYLVGYSGNKVPLAPYATFGTQALADHIAAAIGHYNACLMANHGLVTVGPNLATAFAAAEEIELVARIYYQARCIGNPVILSDEEMAVVGEKFKTYGQKK